MGDYSRICEDYLLDNYLTESKKYKIIKSVHIQAGWERSDKDGESKWLQSLYDKYQFPSGIVCYVDLSAKDYVEQLELNLNYASLRGVRQIINFDSNSYYSGTSIDYLSQEVWRRNLSILANYNLSFDMQIFPEQIDSAVDLIKSNPNLIFIIDHFAMPKYRTIEYFNFWKEQIAKLSKLENVYLKLSGFGMFEHSWHKESIKPFIETSISHFGIKRCMFASNFPVDKLYKTFDEIYDIYMESIQDYGSEEKSNLFYLNAEKIYRI